MFILFLQMIHSVVDNIQEPPQFNISTSHDDNDGEATFNEDSFEESEYVSHILGEIVVKTETGDVIEEYGGMLTNDFCYTEDGFIETK